MDERKGAVVEVLVVKEYDGVLCQRVKVRLRVRWYEISFNSRVSDELHRLVC